MVLVIGMHRSGTSATAGALQQVGVPLGARLYKGHKGINDKGYFEHSDIADLNEELLLSMGSSWDDIVPLREQWESSASVAKYVDSLRRIVRRDFAGKKIWALKDPRIPRLVPMWLRILSQENFDPLFLFSVRTPDAVSRSLEKRDGFSREKSYLLWLLHYLEAERASRGHKRVFVSYDRFLDNPVVELERAETMLGVRFPISPQSAAQGLSDFLSKGLRNYANSSSAEAPSQIEELAVRLYSAIEPSTIGGQPSEAEVDDVQRNLQVLYDGFPAVLLEHMKSYGDRHGELQLLSNRLVRSWSWVFGKPVRYIERLLKRDV